MNDRLMFRAEIAGTGAYLPEKILRNSDLEKTLDTTDEWIQSRTGIKERRIAAKDESSSVLAANASRLALKSAGVEPGEVDLIIVCTSTPDILFPATACFVQEQLGANNAAAYDISAVCSGFIFGLSTGEQFIKSGRYKNVLVVGSEVNSRIVDWTDRSTCILFGDGAGAVLLQRNESKENIGVLSSHMYSDGTLAKLIEVPGGIGRTGINQSDLDEKRYYINMNGGATFKVAVKRMATVAKEALDFNGVKVDDLDLIVPHQANKRIISAVTEKLNVPMDKVFLNISKYGNTSAASIPIALHEARECGRIQPGNLVLLMVVGAGLTWGATLIRW